MTRKSSSAASSPSNSFDNASSVGRYVCSMCSKVYRSGAGLRYHKRKRHRGEGMVEPTALHRVKCQEFGCGYQMLAISDLRNHLANHHQKPEYKCTEEKKFTSLVDFTDWKSSFESSTGSKYVKNCGAKGKSDNQTTEYYYCNRTGPYKTDGQGLRRNKVQGSLRGGIHCTSSMKVEIQNDEHITVQYYPAHYGHSNLPATDDPHLSENSMTITGVNTHHPHQQQQQQQQQHQQQQDNSHHGGDRSSSSSPGSSSTSPSGGSNSNSNYPPPALERQSITISNSFPKTFNHNVHNNINHNNNNNNNNNGLQKQFISRIDKIWKENDSYYLSGPVFIQPSDINNREQLIVTSKCFYEREVIKRDGPSTQIALHNIRGKCSVLSVKHFCTHRLTEISESDVYVCESKYVIDDHSLRGLSKPLKRISLSSKATADEIWTFRKELLLKQEAPGGLLKLVDEGSVMDVDDSSNHIVNGDDHHSHIETSNSGTNLNSSFSNRYSSNRKSNRRVSITRPISGYLVFASESRKRLIKDNPGIPFGEMSRMIGDQWRRLTASERDIYEEKARERAREQEQVVSTPPTPVTNNNTSSTNFDTHNMPVINPQRIVNGTVTINGHYQTNPNIQNVHQMNGNIQTIQKPPAAAIVTCPPRTQRLVHSEAYLRYIENLKPDNQFISDWPKQLKASINNTTNTSNGNNASRTLPSNWLLNGSPGLYNNVHEALWSMRDNMWSDVIRIRNVLSDEW